MIKISSKVQQIAESASISVSDRASTLRASGEDVQSLSFGEPDFDTPEFIKASAVRALERGETKYSKVDGTDRLKQAIQQKLAGENDLSYEANEIIVSNGAKHSLFNAFFALIEPANEVIVPAPYWVSYIEAIRLCGGKPVIVKTEIANGLKITPQQLSESLTSATKALILNSPNNPTGAIYSQAELTALAAVLKDHPDVVVISDDIYEHIRWTEDQFRNFANVDDEAKRKTLVVNGVSKSLAMTGWRIGYAAGPAELVAAMKKIQSHTTSGANTFAQEAAAEAILGDKSEMRNMILAYKRRHDYAISKIKDIPYIDCRPADGAFYAFPDVSELMAKRGFDSDVVLCKALLDEQKVAVVPGAAYGANGFMRLSFATSIQNLEIALDRIDRFARSNT